MEACPGVQDGAGVRLVVPFAGAVFQFDQEFEVDLHDQLEVAEDLCTQTVMRNVNCFRLLAGF